MPDDDVKQLVCIAPVWEAIVELAGHRDWVLRRIPTDPDELPTYIVTVTPERMQAAVAEARRIEREEQE